MRNSKTMIHSMAYEDNYKNHPRRKLQRVQDHFYLYNYAESTTFPPDHKTPTSPLLIDMNHYDEYKGNFNMKNYLPLAHTSATNEDNEGLVQRRK